MEISRKKTQNKEGNKEINKKRNISDRIRMNIILNISLIKKIWFNRLNFINIYHQLSFKSPFSSNRKLKFLFHDMSPYMKSAQVTEMMSKIRV